MVKIVFVRFSIAHFCFVKFRGFTCALKISPLRIGFIPTIKERLFVRQRGLFRP